MGNQIQSSKHSTNPWKVSLEKVNKYVGMGASDAVGLGTRNPSKDGWVPKFGTLINAETTISLGRTGSTLAEAMHEQLPKVLQIRPDVVTIWLAVNDFNQQVFDRSLLTSYTADLNEMLFQLRTQLGRDTRILVGNIPDLSKVSIYTSLGIPKFLLTVQVKRWNDAIKHAARKHQCELIDLYSHWKELADHPEYVSFDGFHPSADGYDRLAELFYQHFSK